MAFLDNFYFQLYGPENGRKWVFVHGLMGYGANWRKIVSGLEATERCLTYDQRGHGRSMKPLTGYTPEDYASDLKEILDELGWSKIVLVGHSMGGRNVLNFAYQYPEYVSQLVIEDIGAEANPSAHEYYENLLDLIPVPFESRTAARDYFMGEFVKVAQTKEPVQILAQYFYSNVEEKEDGSVNWKFSKDAIIESVKAGRENDRWAEVKALTMPTLLIRGENSKELSSESYKKMLDLNEVIRGVEISQAGHWVHSDQPQDFLTAIKSFVGGF
jgi:esterase